MIGPLSYIQIGAGVALGALIASGPVYLYGKHEGRQQAVVEQLKSDVQAERDRNQSDAKLSTSDPAKHRAYARHYSPESFH